MTWNHKLRWKTSFITTFSLLIVACCATVPRLCAGQTYDDTALYIDDPTVSSFNDSVSATYVDQEPSPDTAYRQLVAGNARYLKEDLPAAQAVPRIAAGTNQYPIATIVYSPDMPVQPTTLTQTNTRNVYLTPIDSGAVSAEDLPAIEYGLVNLQTPLLVVLGHYPSRSVAAMIREYDDLKVRAKVESERIAQSGTRTIPNGVSTEQMKRYNLVGPAIARTREAYPDLQGYDFGNIVSEALVWQSLETILMKSTVAQDLIRVGRLNVIAAIVDDKTGKIYWLGSHPLQDEFLKPIPQNLANAEITSDALYESDLPQALDDTAVQTYVDLYENSSYYNQIVYDYYSDPQYYEPSWELFSQRAWLYRPWYGVWVTSFTPWPYWSPWAPPQDQPGLGVSFWDGGVNFFIGYNRGYGAPVYYDPHFRPRDPWWGRDYYARFDPRRHDPVFGLIIDGRRSEIVYGPPPAPWDRHEPGGYRPGAIRPGVAITLGALRIAFGDSPRGPIDPKAIGNPRGGRPDDLTPPRPGGPMPARPGGSAAHRPGNPWGSRPGFPGVRPGGGTPPRGNFPINHRDRIPGARPGQADPTPGARPGQTNPTPGVRPGQANPTPGARPGQTNPTPGARPGQANPTPGVRPGQANPTPGARPGGRLAREPRVAPETSPITNASAREPFPSRAERPANLSDALRANSRRVDNRPAALPTVGNDVQRFPNNRRAPDVGLRNQNRTELTSRPDSSPNRRFDNPMNNRPERVPTSTPRPEIHHGSQHNGPPRDR